MTPTAKWLLLPVFLALPGTVLAAAPAPGGLDWTVMVMGLFGGLALFLFGMDQMADALKAVAGDRMRNILGRLTSNRFSAAATGAFMTAVIQSSSVTTVLVVGFISAGMLTMSQSIGIILGANVGTTVTAQIVAFQVTEWALAMVAIGFAMVFFARTEGVRHSGNTLMGLGLVFFGMSIMSSAMAPLRDYSPFLEFMVRMEQPLLGMLVAALFTALVQSSSAATGVVVIMASQGFITLPAGIAMALGANIGTCVTAALAAIGKPREAVRASLIHVLFNIIGVLLWLGFIDELALLATWLSPSCDQLEGVAKLAAEAPRQIANANTLFNLINAMLFLGFTTYLARLVNRLLPDRPPREDVVIMRPKFLDDELISTPSMALERVRMEFGHLGEVVQEMYGRVRPSYLTRNRELLGDVAKMDDQVDILHANIIQYLAELRQQKLSESESDTFVKLLSAVDSLENIGDVIDTGLMPVGHRILNEDLHFSEDMREALLELYKTVADALQKAAEAVRERNERAAQEVMTIKAEVDRHLAGVLQHQAEKLGEGDPKRLSIFRAEMEIANDLKRIYSLARRIAKTELPGELTKPLE